MELINGLYHDFYYDMSEEPTGDSLFDIQLLLTNLIEKSRETGCPCVEKAASFISVWLTKMAFSDNIEDLEEDRYTMMGALAEYVLLKERNA